MLFRIGINLGDILIEGDDILGDGVNVAARLEGIAEPGGICISSSAYEQVRGKVPVEFTDLGEQTLKNIARPIRAYAVGLKRECPSNRRRVPPSAPHLSIVVLPFANIGGDPEQEYFVDGVTESLTTDLSRISGAFVIARNTAFTFKGKAVDAKKLGRELNVRYVLEGSVQRGGNRLRVNVQLIDAETGNHLWAERFDKPVADLFDMQDEIVSRLANALNAELIAAEARRAELSANPDATDLVFQGWALFNRGMDSRIHDTSARLFRASLGTRPRKHRSNGRIGVGQCYGGSCPFDGRSVSAVCGSRGNLHQSVVPCAEPRCGALGFGHRPDVHETRGPGHCRVRACVGAGPQFSQSLIALSGMPSTFLVATQKPKLTLMRRFASLLAIHLCPQWLVWVGIAKVALNADTEAVAWLRRGLEANRNYSTRAFPTRGCSRAARRDGRGASGRESRTCARSQVYNPPLACRQRME